MINALKSKGSELLGQVANQLLANEKFIHAVQMMVSRGLEFKEGVDQAVQGALTTFRIPTADDLRHLTKRVAEVEAGQDLARDKEAAMEARLERLAARVEELERAGKEASEG